MDPNAATGRDCTGQGVGWYGNALEAWSQQEAKRKQTGVRLPFSSPVALSL